MKKRILSVLLVLVLVVGILPIGVSAAENTVTSDGKYFSLQYQNDGLVKNTMTFNLYGINGTIIDKKVVNDATSANQWVDISLNTPYSENYDIARVEVSNSSASSENISDNSYRALISAPDEAIINIYLTKQYETPELPDDLIENLSYTRFYRLYNAQIYKMLYAADVEVTKDTTIVSIKPSWRESFAEDNKSFDSINREEDYWHLTVTSSDADVDDVQPTNIRYLTITYKNGDSEKSLDVYSGDLRYTIDQEASSRYYNIELADDSFHIVYFYWDEWGDANNFDLYDFKIVGNGDCLNKAMPDDPTYPDATDYAFVAWTEDFDGGRPFLETTPVTEDISVYAQKTTTISNRTEIHIMNNGNLFKERIAELYNVNVTDIKWDELLVSVVASDGRATNPNYDLGSPDVPFDHEKNHWVNEDYFFVYNYLTGVGAQQNTSLHTTEMVELRITATKTDRTPLGTVTISKGIYDGDFWPSVGEAAHITEIYINVNNTPNPDPEPSNSYDVIYDHNGKGSYNGQWDTKTDADIPYDSTYTILDNMFAGDDLNGWVLDGWSLSPNGSVAFHPGEEVAFNNSTFPGLTEQGSITLYAIWAVDQLGGEDGDEPDQIPDYQQVFVKYVSADPAMGSVAPSFEKFDVNGTIALAGKATASTGYAFEKWTCEDATGDPDFPVSDSEKIDYTLKTPTGGTVYTFTCLLYTSPSPRDCS